MRSPGFVLPGRWLTADLSNPDSADALRDRIRTQVKRNGLATSTSWVPDNTYSEALLKLDVDDVQLISYRWTDSGLTAGDTVPAGDGFVAVITGTDTTDSDLAIRDYHVQPLQGQDALDIRVTYVGAGAAEKISKYDAIAGHITWKLAE